LGGRWWLGRAWLGARGWGRVVGGARGWGRAWLGAGWEGHPRDRRFGVLGVLVVETLPWIESLGVLALQWAI
jgi:hypothetical protein